MEVANTVCKAVPEDLPEVSSALSRAFFDDPPMAWAIPDEDRCQRAEDAACNLHLIGRCVAAVNTATTAVPRRHHVPRCDSAGRDRDEAFVVIAVGLGVRKRRA
jgi:hypothetical protein